MATDYERGRSDTLDSLRDEASEAKSEGSLSQGLNQAWNQTVVNTNPFSSDDYKAGANDAIDKLYND